MRSRPIAADKPVATEFFGVQGLRGLAACMIVVYHATQLWVLKTQGPNTTRGDCASIGAALLLYRFVEKPLTHALRGRLLHERRPVTQSAG